MGDWATRARELLAAEDSRGDLALELLRAALDERERLLTAEAGKALLQARIDELEASKR